MWRTLLIALGGMIGAVARYWLTVLVQQASGLVFPLGILIVNMLGSFVLGVVMALSFHRGVISDDIRLLLAVGVCGGFTTMSTFSYDTLALARAGESLLAAANVATTLIGCIAAVWLGDYTARLL